MQKVVLPLYIITVYFTQANTTTELYIFSLVVSWGSILSTGKIIYSQFYSKCRRKKYIKDKITGLLFLLCLYPVFFLVRGSLCLIHKLFPDWLRDTCLWGWKWATAAVQPFTDTQYRCIYYLHGFSGFQTVVKWRLRWILFNDTPFH